VLLVPGIGGSYVDDLEQERNWLLHRGVHPDQLATEPLNRTYDAMIATLEQAGYVQGEDLFVANYDWRLTPAPDDGAIDGHINGLSADVQPADQSLISITDSEFEFGVDYIGFWLRRIAETWANRHNSPLDAWTRSRSTANSPCPATSSMRHSQRRLPARSV
jgi:hypothetical protein